MQEKVKIFTRGTTDDFQDLENEVNDWIKNLPTLEIISRHTGIGSGVNALGIHFINCTICIFYKGGD